MRSKKAAKKRRADHGVPRKGKREKHITNLLYGFGKYLTERRERDNLTFRIVGERGHIPHSSVYQIEQANKDPHLSELMRLAQAFNESLPQFLMPFLQEEEPLDAPAEGGERKETFAEIPAPQQGLSAVTETDDRYSAAGADKHEGSRAERSVPPQNVTEMPANRTCGKCGFVHAVGMACPGPDAVFGPEAAG